MEDVLEVYHRPEEPRRPLICLDEADVQLLGEVREPLPLRPGDPLCVDSEYQREGGAYFLLMAPRHVEVTGTRTKADYARVLKTLDEKFPLGGEGRGRARQPQHASGRHAQRDL